MECERDEGGREGQRRGCGREGRREVGKDREGGVEERDEGRLSYSSSGIILPSLFLTRPTLPLPGDVPVQFSAIPEFFVDTMAEFILFCSQ